MPRCIWRSRCLTTSTPRRVELSSESDCPAVVVGRVRRSRHPAKWRHNPKCPCSHYVWQDHNVWQGYNFYVNSGQIALPVDLLRYVSYGAGAHRGGQSPPLYPGLGPAKSPLRGPFDLSLQAAGRAEAASLQNTALSPHPCGLPRPSGNVSAMLRPPAPAVSVAQVGK